MIYKKELSTALETGRAQLFFSGGIGSGCNFTGSDEVIAETFRICTMAARSATVGERRPVRYPLIVDGETNIALPAGYWKYFVYT